MTAQDTTGQDSSGTPDPVLVFLTACAVPDENSVVETQQFHAVYNRWAEDNGHPTRNLQSLGIRLRQTGLLTSVRGLKTHRNGWQGYRLLDEPVSEETPMPQPPAPELIPESTAQVVLTVQAYTVHVRDGERELEYLVVAGNVAEAAAIAVRGVSERHTGAEITAITHRGPGLA